MGDKASNFNVLKGYKINFSEIRNVKWNIERRLQKTDEERGCLKLDDLMALKRTKRPRDQEQNQRQERTC